MPRTSIFDMPFPKGYEALVKKAEKTERTKAEVDEVTHWLTGYSALEEQKAGKTYGEFMAREPSWPPALSILQGRSAAYRWR